MPGTMVEKIFEMHTDDEVAPGRIIWLDLDVRSARDFAGANVVKNLEEWYPGEGVADTGRTFFTFDCVVPPNNIPYANNQQTCRDWARSKGVKVYDCDQGIGSHVMMEEGLAIPGGTAVGTDSHLNILGAVGCFGQGMGDQDIAIAFKIGRTWFEVPETIRIDLVGMPPKGATPKDVTLFILGELGSRGGLGRAMEFYGQYIDKLSMDGRITLASMATEMGAIIGLIPANSWITEYSVERSAWAPKPVQADTDAEYTQRIEINITAVVPMIACPPKPDAVSTLSEVAGKRIDSAFIGSCTNGRYEDIAPIAQMVNGKHIAEGVYGIIAPATREVYGRLMKEGHLETLFDAGFIVSSPGCGGCASGQAGMIGVGQVQVSTGNRNFPGKQGMGDMYLASPETVAASALLGRIASEEEVVL